MKRLNPAKLVLLYAVLHIVLSIAIYFFIPDDGGASFNFITKAISNLPYGILAVTIISCLMYRKWSKANWPGVIVMLVIGLLPVIVYIVRLLFFGDADDML